MTRTTELAGVKVSIEHFINGERVASADRFEDCSPIDGSHLADVCAGGAAETDAAVAAARQAFPAWAGLGPEGRAPILKRFAQKLRDWGEGAQKTMQQNLSEYLAEESRAVPSRHEVDVFRQDVNKLRDDVARFEARLNRMQILRSSAN